MTPLKPIKIIVYAIACCCFILLRCADNIVDGGTETGNAFGVIYNPNGSRAVNAKVYFVPVNYNPITGPGVSSIDSTITNDTGAFEVDSLPQGYYNILGSGDSGVSFNDSVLIQGDTTNENISDTLRDAGSLSGVVRLQPGDDPRTILILVFGTQTWTAPIDSVGNFTIANMAEGTYHVRILSTLDDYGVLDTNLSIQAGTVDTVIDTIYLPFTGIPVPQGLSLAYDTLKQIVTLTWDACDTNLVKGYNTYRKHSDSDFVKINTALITDTTYSDSSAIQDQNYEYKITAVDKDDNEGKKSEGVRVVVEPGFTLIKSIPLGSIDPYRFVLDSDSMIYTVDRTQAYIIVFNMNGDSVNEFGNGLFRQLYDIAMDSKEMIYVVDPDRDKVSKFNTDGNNILEWPINNPTSIEVDNLDNIYICFSNEDSLAIFDTLGNFIDSCVFITATKKKPCFGKNNHLYISDKNLMQVLEYDEGDNLINSFSVPDELPSYTILNVDSYGNMYLKKSVTVEQQGKYEIHVYNGNGEAVARFGRFSMLNDLTIQETSICLIDYNNNPWQPMLKIYTSPF